jgi:hypothetical protein
LRTDYCVPCEDWGGEHLPLFFIETYEQIFMCLGAPPTQVGGRFFGRIYNHNNFSALIFVQLAQMFSQNPGASAFCTKTTRKICESLCILTIDFWCGIWYNSSVR